MIPRHPDGASRRRGDERGFTLIELLVAVSLMGVVGAVTVGGVVRSLQVTTVASARVEAMTDLQRVQERITRAVRAADPIGVATPDQLQVTVHDDALRRRVLTFTKAGAVLRQREVTFPSPAGAATSDVTTVMTDLLDPAQPAFAYHTGVDADPATADVIDPWGTPAVLSDIRQVDVLLTGQVTGADGSTDAIPLASSAQVRNHDGT